MEEQKNWQLECRLLEIDYRKLHKKGFSIFNIKSYDCFPNEWFLNENYEYKCNVLKEALEKKCLIRDTELYSGMIEGVRYSK